MSGVGAQRPRESDHEQGGQQDKGDGQGQNGPVDEEHFRLDEDRLLIFGRRHEERQDESVAGVAVGPVLAPRRAAPQGHVQGDEKGGEQGAEEDAHVEAGVVGVRAFLVVVGVVVEVGAVDGAVVGEKVS